MLKELYHQAINDTYNIVMHDTYYSYTFLDGRTLTWYYANGVIYVSLYTSNNMLVDRGIVEHD